MKTEDFWLIVQRARQQGSGEPEQLAALTRELQRLPEAELRGFETHVNAQLQRLDTEVLRDIATQLWVLPDDAWRHFRGWCIGEGRAFVTELLANPTKVLKRVSDTRAGPFDPPNGELFLYCAEYARVARARAVA
jgi:hypothetical protein